MVRISFDQKPFRKMMMHTWGAECVASPSTETNAGRAVLANPVGDLVEVFQADDVGVLAPDDAEGYGTALAGLLKDLEKTARLGRTARQVAEQKYAWKQVAEKLIAVYRSATFPSSPW